MRRPAALALAAAPPFLVVTAVDLSPAVRRIDRSADLVEHTHQVLDRAEGLLSTLKDAETGQRGQPPTGDPRHLEPCDTASARVGVEIDALRRLVVGKPN